MKKVHAHKHGIALKKSYGQHFLHDQSVIDHMLQQVSLNDTSSVFEIGCGDGFLTRSILAQPLQRLWVFEIDQEWADYVQKKYPDPRLQMYHANILDIDFSIFEAHKPWVLLSNLPYQVTFPILHVLQQNRNILKEGVIMVQEEVAQKIIKTSGRGYGYISLFFQHFFEWSLLRKVAPSAFHPAPKVYSRLLYFRPKIDLVAIPQEQDFWIFVKRCFLQPRRTLRNNLRSYHYNLDLISSDVLDLRAQQLSFDQILSIWKELLSLSDS